MLLNASHVITNCGLPEHIQTRYVRYKQGNRAIVAWMTRYGPEQFKGRKTLPIKQLITLGNFLCDHVVDIDSLPPDVDYYFQEVIKERAYLSNHYRSFRDRSEADRIDTINHEHFTSSLQVIYDTLKKSRSSLKDSKYPRNTRKSSSSASSMSSPFLSISNTFVLGGAGPNMYQSASEDEEADCSDTTSITSGCSSTECGAAITESCSEQIDEDFLDHNGQLALKVEATLLASKLDQMAHEVETCWRKVGQGAIHATVATACTNVILQQIPHELGKFEESTDSRASIEHLSNIAVHDRDHNSGRGTNSRASSIISLLKRIELCVRRVSQLPCGPCEAELNANPTDYAVGRICEQIIQTLPESLAAGRDSTLTQDAITALLSTNQCSSPGYRSTNPLHVCITYAFIGVAQSAYCSVLDAASDLIRPRVQVLQLANEASKSVAKFIDSKEIFPCYCPNTLGHRIQSMQHDLQVFAKVRCWNAFMQSPLSAGNQVLEVLDLCSYYGMHLFHYRHYVASIIHSYNALLATKSIECIDAMEDLISTFAPILWPLSTRPSSGFSTVWLRYVGARIRFKKDRRKLNHQETWCMAIPAHAAARSAGLNISRDKSVEALGSKFDYGCIDPLIRLKRAGWITGDINMPDSAVASSAGQTPDGRETEDGSQGLDRHGKHKRSRSCVNKDYGSKIHDAVIRRGSCLDTEHILTSAMQGTADETKILPTSRINLFEIFHTMTRVVSRISDSTHAIDSRENAKLLTAPQAPNDGKGQMCLCFAQTILQGADRVIDNRRKRGFDGVGTSWTKNEKECIACFKTHLVAEIELAGVNHGTAGSWLWTSI